MKRVHATATWKKYIEDNYFEDGYMNSKAAIAFLQGLRRPDPRADARHRCQDRTLS